MSSNKGSIELQDVHLDFGVGRAATRAVEEMSLTVAPGQFISLLGPSGCGKSTVLNMIAGFLKPTAGHVLIDGVPVSAPGADRGVVFQKPALFPWKTVRENVALGPRMQGWPKALVEERTDTLLRTVGLLEFGDHYPDSLSGGMQQRVGIARALANDPSVLLMDEPFGALDAQTRELMQDNLLRIWAKNRVTLVFVTHDIEEAVFLSERIIIMSSRPGRVIADIAVDFPYPRAPDVIDSADFVEIKRQCREIIRVESMKAFDEQRAADLQS
jgi:NitT/TauT family transport system ATP-binding protein